jgi:predicted transcriptional regulator of viral defense system
MKKPLIHEYIIGSSLATPNAVAYWSALSFYGLTEQIPFTTFIQTTVRKKKQTQEIFGLRYKIIKIKKEKFFGLKEISIYNKFINITDKEKTIVDCLDKPQYCGGIVEVAKAIKSREYDKDKLVEYTKKINNTGVIRRLGYLCDYLDIDIKLPKINTRNYLYLDPTMTHKGKPHPKWKLKINLDDKILNNLE